MSPSESPPDPSSRAQVDSQNLDSGSSGTNAEESLIAIPQFQRVEPDSNEPLSGYYYKVELGELNKANFRTASDNVTEVSTCLDCELWTKPYSDIIQRLTGIQLITKSRDQGWVSEPWQGNWTWFEVCLVDEEKNEERRWMSHENAFLTNSTLWRDGTTFGPQHELLRLLKESPLQHKRLRVQAGRCFDGWAIPACQGFLIFNIGCETAFNRESALRDLGQATYRPITVAGRAIRITNDSILQRGPAVKVTYKQVAQREQVSAPYIPRNTLQAVSETPTQVLIYHVTSSVELLNIVGTDFNRVLVVIDAPHLLEDYGDDGYFSWDKAVEELSKVAKQETFKIFRKFHVVIRLGNEGAIYRSPASHPSGNRQILIFDAHNSQGHFLRRGLRQTPNKAVLEGKFRDAYLAGLAASLSAESTTSLEELCGIQVREAVMVAIRWSQRYAVQAATATGTSPALPARWQSLEHDVAGDSVLIPVDLPGDVAAGNDSLVFEALPYRPIKHAARDIVRKGREAVLSLVPTARFKALATADRFEIEGFRKIARDIQGYVNGETTRPAPLSIAVFGQPGSGKSFGIEQVILSVMEESGKMGEVEMLKFDLSQFQRSADFQVAFETIRDCSIRGKRPVVFFDEFDSTFNHQPLYWVQHLLEPIEKGTWKNKAKVECRLDNGIYVFIGGTAKTMKEFKSPDEPAAPSSTAPLAREATREEGINEDQTAPEAHSEPSEDPDSSDSPEDTGSEGVPKDCKALESFLYNKLRRPRDADGNPARDDPDDRSFYFKMSSDKTYTELTDFFYKIRERTFSGKPPVVFLEGFDTDLSTSSHGDDNTQPAGWFDWLKSFFYSDDKTRRTERLGWLKYFLAPMQDGAFMDGGHSRPLGRAIFVFIGGESGEIQAFLDRLDSQENGQHQDAAAAVFRKAKGPDFMSRLQGYVTENTEHNDYDCLKTVIQRYQDGGKAKPLSLGFFRKRTRPVPTPSTEEGQDSEQPQDKERQRDIRSRFEGAIKGRFVNILGPDQVVGQEDKMYVLRRAILLRSMIDRLPKKLNIRPSDEVLNALLDIPRFHHGARSLEAILSMSRLVVRTDGPPRQEPEPPLTDAEKMQLKLHVNWKELGALLERGPVPKEVAQDSEHWRAAEMMWHRMRFSGPVKP
ncbi:uncharacterized protein C8A04DRAFT_27231 [Dichotomopilus funicola]|uniref:ATPase AAA-type core domain-containing protein n=1 Tax=Dichotomopilus funicola TaxID=1934379 RepID=A0AAN6ZP08_9PEZI|nr:hypothetical protein C8A04DRAFT_27231 [Dichotomopilus funicola]